MSLYKVKGSRSYYRSYSAGQSVCSQFREKCSFTFYWHICVPDSIRCQQSDSTACWSTQKPYRDTCPTSSYENSYLQQTSSTRIQWRPIGLYIVILVLYILQRHNVCVWRTEGRTSITALSIARKVCCHALKTKIACTGLMAIQIHQKWLISAQIESTQISNRGSILQVSEILWL